MQMKKGNPTVQGGKANFAASVEADVAIADEEPFHFSGVRMDSAQHSTVTMTNSDVPTKTIRNKVNIITCISIRVFVCLYICVS